MKKFFPISCFGSKEKTTLLSKNNETEQLIPNSRESRKVKGLLQKAAFMFFLLLSFNGFGQNQSPCSGNVPIENLANGMDYTITVGAGGVVDITLTVVDNPPGLVGFLGGAGNPISFPDATGTFTYSLTGQPDPYTLDMFFNWAAGGAGNSETVICASASPTVCSGNVPIENLANGMDYTITVGAGGVVDITLTVVDNPPGLVGFLGGAGNPISFPDATGTFTYSLTGQPDPYVLDMFFNWAAGGQGNSETVTCGSAGPEICMGNVPIENLANGMDYSLTVEANGDVEITLTVVDNPPGLVGFLGGAGNPISFPDATGTFTYSLTGQTVPYTLDMFFNWAAGGQGNSETVFCPDVGDTEVTFCVDMSCFLDPPLNPSVFGNFTIPPFDPNQNPLSDPDGDGIWCATTTIAPGTYEYLFFDGNQGAEGFDPGAPCTVTNFGFTNRELVVGTTSPQTETFGWESCGLNCVTPLGLPDLPITFEDQATIDYNLFDFAGAVSSIQQDPTDPTNTVVCTNKTNGAAPFAGTVVGNDGLENPIPFTATEQKMVVRVWSPTAGTPVLLKVENSGNGGISSEVIATTTLSMQWETLVFDFANGAPPLNLANVYDKVVIFFDFGAVGNNALYYFDDIMMCPSAALTLTCPANVTVACDGSLDPMDTGMPTADEVGGGAIVFTFEDVSDVNSCDGGTITRTWTGTDGCGNTGTCDQMIIVTPAPGPTITCPADQVVSCQDDIVLDPNDAVATASACSNIVATYIKNPLIAGVPGCNGTVYTYIYVTVDDCGNTAECEQQFLIQDAAQPTITVPMGTEVECFKDIEISLSDASVSGGCADYNLYLVPPVVDGPTSCPGTTYTYVYRLIDACGNTIEEPVVFSNGNTEGPTIDAPANTTVNCLASVNANPDNAVVTTSCGVESNVTVTGPVISGSTDCPGSTYTYTYTVTDECGRTASDVQVYTVSNEGPVFAGCDEDNWLQFNCEDFGGEDGTIAAIEAYIASVKASSSCGNQLTVTNNFNSNNINTCINNGINTITFRATDNCGRTSFCTTTYVVIDTEAPVITAEAEDHWEICNFNSQANLDAWVDNLGGAEAFDGCSNDNVNWTVSPSNPQINCDGVLGTTSVTVTFIVTDNCGNKTETTATFNTLPQPGFSGGSNDQETESASINLFQNQPNPFKNETLISFYLPSDMDATLVIYDVSGRALKTIQGSYAKGLNNLSVSSSELNTTGFLIYQLNTELGSLTKRMILVD